MRYFSSKWEAAWYWFAVTYNTSGLGLFPRKIGRKLKGGGTIGSLVGLGIAAALEHAGCTWMSFILMPVMFFLSMATLPSAECFLALRWGPMRRHKGTEEVTKDYNATNNDEVIPGLGFGIVAHYCHSNWWLAAIVMTLIFRVIDAKKLWPVNVAEEWAKPRYPLDVHLDDLVGMAMTIMIVELPHWYFQHSAGIPFLD